MAKRNIFDALNRTPDGSMPRNVYDLHSYEFLTSKLGQLLPVACRETVPDTTIEMSVDNYTMTFPCNTASFASMKENFYWVFVPYSQIVSNFNTLVVGRDDPQSALDLTGAIEQVPWFPLGTVVRHCLSLSSTSTVDVHGFKIAQGALRLLDLLGYGCYLDYLTAYSQSKLSSSLLDAIEERLNSYHPNVLRLAAYQKIWYCYFRNKVYDIDVTADCFNFDDVILGAKNGGSYNVLDYRNVDLFIRNCLQLRYVGYKKDLFTASMPGTQYGAVSSLSVDLPQMSVMGSGTTGSSFGRYQFVQGADPDYSTNGSTNNIFKSGSNIVVSSTEQSAAFPLGHTHQFTINNAHTQPDHSLTLFDMLQFVEAEAIQKWRQKTMLAGNKTSDQFRAHYGVVPKFLEDHYPDFIGSVDNELQIDKVVSNADTASESDESNLGDLAGRGYGASSLKSFRYHAKDFGVVMLLRSVVTENVYSSYGLDRANQLVYGMDFFIPEYQNIGLEAVDKIQLDITVAGTPFDNETPDYEPTSRILGYAPRNYQLKQYVSRTHGMFNPNRLGEFRPHLGQSYFGFSNMQAFVQPRKDLVAVNQFVYDAGSTTPKEIAYGRIDYTLSRFYVNPSIANPTFAFDADSNEDSDIFVHRCRANFSAVMPLTELGLPQF